ncbi:hypothetical protein F183_A13930 [Bryobacterales bacterium F-183]|nr:hypothetical protein F183_A13930 [Bryobacterales bacterium F-183]
MASRPVIALDATYSVDTALSGVGVYSREIMWGLAEAHPEAKFNWCYRPHKILRSLADRFPRNASRKLLHYGKQPPKGSVFHALNQRVETEGGARLTPIVTTFHDLFVMTGDYSTPDFRKRFTDQALRAAERSDCIIAVSAFTAEQVKALLNPDVPVHVVHHGVYTPSAPPPGDADRENIILHVGSIQKRKNLIRLIQAFEALENPEWRLVLAGSPKGFGAEEVLEAAKASTAAARIEITGYLEPADLEALYRKARIFAFPSLDEGFGIPVIEAMAAGVPVITSDGSALHEVAGESAVLIEPNRTDSLVEAVRALVAAPGLRNQLRQAGYQRAKEFPWSKAIKGTWDCYQSVIRR